MKTEILNFNSCTPSVMYIDLNSCFAAIEQQANPRLRGRPIAVTAYNSPRGCILAASVEAKKMGVKTGMRAEEGKKLCPDLIILPPDVEKYRYIHLKLKKLLQEYSADLSPKSIDEFVLNFAGYPAFKQGMVNVGKEIKFRIKKEIGEWLTVSIGFGPNRFLAKTASNLHKPDGLDIIDKDNFLAVYSRLQLPDLCGIARQNTLRLNTAGIYTVLAFYRASIYQLKAVFHSILAYYWYWRLRGWEIDGIDFGRKSFGNSFALPKPLSDKDELRPILAKLTSKSGQRLRRFGYKTKGVHLGIIYRDFSGWHKGKKLFRAVFDSRDIYREICQLLASCPYTKPVRELNIACFNLVLGDADQLALFEDINIKSRLVSAIDKINNQWGDFVVKPGRMLGTNDLVPDRISFGGVKELI